MPTAKDCSETEMEWRDGGCRTVEPSVLLLSLLFHLTWSYDVLWNPFSVNVPWQQLQRQHVGKVKQRVMFSPSHSLSLSLSLSSVCYSELPHARRLIV